MKISLLDCPNEPGNDAIEASPQTDTVVEGMGYGHDGTDWKVIESCF